MRVIYLFLLCSLSLSLFGQVNYNLNLVGSRPYTQDLNDIWGWVSAGGTEYALVGTQTGVSIVSLADPSNPTQVQFIPGATSVWRDLKTWGNYAYITCDQGNDGLLIIDLSTLPGSVNYINWRPALTINGDTDTLRRAHNLYIDENGVAYIAGANVGVGEPFMLDVNTNPWLPALLGSVPPIYAHDVYARGDTLWTSDIYDGVFSAYNVTNKAAPVLLGSHSTPNTFTHNTWISDDGNTLFTTDEVNGAYIGSYDVSNTGNITELDRWQPFETQNVIPHNVHVKNDFIVISYYTDGLIVLDGSRPDNLVEVGRYDTYLNLGNGFNGCWGAYPFLPSGLILASDINTGFYAFQPAYARACWLEGNVTDTLTSNPIFDVLVEINTTSVFDNSKLNGNYKTGYGIAGAYNVTFSKAGYVSKTIAVNLQNNVVTLEDVQLMPLSSFAFSGTVVDADNSNAPIANARVLLESSNYTYTATTNASGQFTIPSMFADSYEIYAGKWGYKTVLVNQSLNAGSSAPTIPLNQGYRDEFALDLGWTTAGNATSGQWARANSEHITVFGQSATPDGDLSFDIGNKCYISGDQNNGSLAADDIDGGNIILSSPILDVATYGEPYLSYYAWFVNVQGTGTPNDSMIVRLYNGSTSAVLAVYNVSTFGWTPIQSFKISDYITPSANMWLEVEAFDKSPGHIVEVAFDLFEVIDSLPVAVLATPTTETRINAYPNPFKSSINIEFEADFNADKSEYLQVFNALGQLVHVQNIGQTQKTIELGQDWAVGVYWLKMGATSIKLVKINE